MADKIQIRRDTAANWTSVDPILSDGEQGYETDTGKIKIGDGVTAWTSLGYNFEAAAGYDDSAVDTHLNTSTATTGQVLSYTGTDYDWINAPSGFTNLVRGSFTFNNTPSSYVSLGNSSTTYLSAGTETDWYTFSGSTWGLAGNPPAGSTSAVIATIAMNSGLSSGFFGVNDTYIGTRYGAVSIKYQKTRYDTGNKAGGIGSHEFRVNDAVIASFRNSGTTLNSSAISIPNLPSTDPAVAGRIWSDGGVLVESGSTAGDPNFDPSSGVYIFQNLPAADPVVAGQLWNDAGIMKISIGAYIFSKIVVSALYDDDTALDSGAIYIYNLDGTGEIKIKSSDATNADQFGCSVSAGNQKILVGAFAENAYAGAAYLYNLDGTGEIKITPAVRINNGGDFGTSVSIGDNKIVIGSPGVEDNGNESGAAYIFDLDGTGEIKILPSTGAANQLFGNKVAVGGGKVVVGAEGDNTNGAEAGAVYIYDLDGTNEIKLTPSDAAAGDLFGAGLAVGENKIVVGAPYNDDAGSTSGSIYVYDLDGTNEVKITASDAATLDVFGKNVSVGDGKIVVSATGQDSSFWSVGCVYIYNLDGTNEIKVLPPVKGEYNEFGNSVAISGNKIIVGEAQNDSTAVGSGAIHIYNLDGTGVVTVKASDAAAGASDLFGYSVAVG